MISSIPSDIREALTRELKTTLQHFSFSSGGCINNGGKLLTVSGDYFIKWNDNDLYPGMFEAEAKGLQLLAGSCRLKIPRPIIFGTSARHQFIVLEFIEQGHRGQSYWSDLGAGLAAMHRVTANDFGLDHDNYIGSLPQRNPFAPTWDEFFIEHRLRPQLDLALSNGALDASVVKAFDRLFEKLSSLLPPGQPSLLHGDLWSGNLITTKNGDPCLIDPAVYFGHREAEIAFTRLFGGFASNFYESYNEIYPLEPGFHERSDVYNLYPLLVHVNLFGGGYPSQVVSILNHFV